MPISRLPLSLVAVAVLLVSGARAQTGKPSPASHAPGPRFSPEDQKALGDYHLTLEKLEKFETASKNLQAATDKDPVLKQQVLALKNSGSNRTVEDNVRSMEADGPALLNVLKDSGITPRDYVLTAFSLFSAGMATFLQQLRPDDPLPAYIPADNVAFYEQNRPRIEALFQLGAE